MSDNMIELIDVTCGVCERIISVPHEGVWECEECATEREDYA